MDVKDLGKTGRIYVTYPPELRAGVKDAIAAWEAFCALPEEVKAKVPYGAEWKTSGNGYELKKGNAYDLKENYHLRVTVRDELLANAAAAGPIAVAFIEKALAVNALMAPLLREFTEAIEKEYDIKNFSEDVMANQDFWLLRFLHYFGGRTPGEELAAPHTDKGGFTLHLYESAPGVEQLTYEKEWISMPLPEGQTVIIPGMSLQNRSKNALKATCHRVVALPETADVGRYAAVCFFNFKNQRYFDKSRFGAQQAWPPGAFYDMPFAEFDKLFID